MKGILLIGLALLMPAAGSWQSAHTLARPAYASGAGRRVLYGTAHWNPLVAEGPDNRQFTLNVMHWLSGLLPGR